MEIPVSAFCFDEYLFEPQLWLYFLFGCDVCGKKTVYGKSGTLPMSISQICYVRSPLWWSAQTFPSRHGFPCFWGGYWQASVLQSDIHFLWPLGPVEPHLPDYCYPPNCYWFGWLLVQNGTSVLCTLETTCLYVFCLRMSVMSTRSPMLWWTNRKMALAY